MTKGYPPENAETPARWVPPPADPLFQFLEKVKNKNGYTTGLFAQKITLEHKILFKRPRQIPIYAGWYTDPNIPSPWLMDWPNWEALTLFYESIDGTLIVDKLFKEVYDVPGAITPLAYMMGISPDLHFLFFAAGRYYLYDSGDLYLSD
ncbi:hypothetical protein B0H16DRAFT_1477997 [Mycena metata]|uniref:Uncharacterized protein n=1 Tax=Mycena metata TaxID=1033252 RepID=A0AAD7MF11_9AGAR|nr:hypothetical protein B0H16DRAFT_1477997 [Mycena metata]